MSTQTNQDSELQHSFGPGEVGFDFLPLQAAADAPLPTQPAVTLPTFDLGSHAPMPAFADLPPVPTPPPTNGSANGKFRFWLDGETVLCGCPDCRAPMSVRIWLMTADCWRCGLSIDLSEAEEREIAKLLNARPALAPVAPKPVAPKVEQPVAKAPVQPPPAPKPSAPQAPVVPPPVLKTPQPPPPPAPKAPTRSAVQPGPAGRSPSPPPPPVVPPPPPLMRPRSAPTQVEEVVAPVVAAVIASPPVKQVAPPPPPPRPAVRQQPATRPQTRPAPAKQPEPETDWIKKIFDDTPAWVVSGLVHLIALTLLAMFTIPTDEEEGPMILLSANMSNERVEGGDVNVLPPDLQAQFDMPLPEKMDLKNPDELKTLIAANQDARDLRIDDAPNLPNVDLIKKQVENATGVQQALAARDPRLRVEMVTQEGGTTMTEAAVARGLRWLATHQNDDGSWRLDDFESVNGCNCGGRGHYHTKSPGTALALLPFLGAGQTHLAGKHKGTVSRGLRWLVQHQKDDGDLRHDERGNAGMYTQGQATIVLCEAFAMTGDEELRIPAQKAVDFVVKAQYNDGGWRYQPGPRGGDKGDTSVVGWQLMALQSARAANLNVPERTLLRAGAYLDSCQSDGGAQYAYMAGHAPTPVMTAEALLCRMYLGWNKKQKPALSRGVQTLIRRQLPNKHDPNIYYWYYATQTMHHFGGEEWETWNLQMRDVLTSTQETGGHAAGSWTPRGDHAAAGGRIYMTSLSVCTLEVYYRHLPIFRQIKLD